MKLILLYKWIDKEKLDIIDIDDKNGQLMINLGIAKIYNDSVYNSLKEKEMYDLRGKEKDY